MFPVLLCTHNADMETFVPHEWILYVSGGILCLLLCIDNAGMDTFALHGLILCVSLGFLS